MKRKDQIFEAGQEYSNLMDEFQRYHTYPKDAFIDGAKWADRTMIDKACEYLESVLEHDLGYYGAAEFADNFRKAMEE